MASHATMAAQRKCDGGEASGGYTNPSDTYRSLFKYKTTCHSFVKQFCCNVTIFVILLEWALAAFSCHGHKEG